MKISNFQAKVSDFSDDLISLNKNLVSNKISKTESIIKNRIKDFKNQIIEKKDKIDLILKQPLKMDMPDFDDTTQTSEFFGTSSSLDDIPLRQDLDEVVVTANRNEYFLNKYKFYIIGALVLLFIMFKKK